MHLSTRIGQVRRATITQVHRTLVLPTRNGRIQCYSMLNANKYLFRYWNGNQRVIFFNKRVNNKMYSSNVDSSISTVDKEYAESNSMNEQEQNEEAYRKEYERRVKPVKIWLFTLSGLVFLIIIVGGLTRLEEGGLSMVTWTPLGSLPPMNQQQWEEEFERYKQFPEYQKKKYGMSLNEFKYIYWYEYSHRMLGRLIGLAFAVPAVVFTAKGWIRFKNTPNRILSGGRVLLIGSLIGFQGLLGWYMVKSGLDSEHRLMKEYNTVPRVSQYRLASHLITAFTIYGLCVWTLLDTFSPKRIATSLSNVDSSIISRLKALSRSSPLLAALIFVTAASGAFVAGMDAGLVYNEFPLMGGKLIPSDIGALVPWWRNFFENATTVQFQHRLLATLTSLSIGWLYLQNRFMHKTSWAMLPPQVRLALNAMTIAVAIQYSLGISTLLNYVPTSLASAHQVGSLSLFTVAIYFLHVIKRIRF